MAGQKHLLMAKHTVVFGWTYHAYGTWLLFLGAKADKMSYHEF